MRTCHSDNSPIMCMIEIQIKVIFLCRKDLFKKFGPLLIGIFFTPRTYFSYGTTPKVFLKILNDKFNYQNFKF